MKDWLWAGNGPVLLGVPAYDQAESLHRSLLPFHKTLNPNYDVLCVCIILFVFIYITSALYHWWTPHLSRLPGVPGAQFTVVNGLTQGTGLTSPWYICKACISCSAPVPFIPSPLDEIGNSFYNEYWWKICTITSMSKHLCNQTTETEKDFALSFVDYKH